MPAETILIAAGGTGGHVFPGLAVAEELKTRGYRVEWLGTRIGMESRLVPINGIKLHFFPVEGIRGRGSLALLTAPWKVARSVVAALAIVRQVRPSLIIGLGGFVAGPAGVAARLLQLPLIIHEQNAVPGTTNYLLARIATRVLSAFPVKLPRVQVIGNPIRRSLERVKTEPEPAVGDVQKLRVLVLGGSRGARALNTHLPGALKAAKLETALDIRHQCGAGRADETFDAYGSACLSAKIEEFIDDMDEAMAWAQVIICRAGALTVSEIAVVGLPAILIPYPYAIDDHQTANAEYLRQAGAALVVQEREFNDGLLVTAIKRLLDDHGLRAQMAASSLAAAQRGVASRFVDICEAEIS